MNRIGGADAEGLGLSAPPLRTGQAVAAAVALLVLSTVVTWPMAVSGGPRDHADTLYNAWLLAWNSHAIAGLQNPLEPPVFLGQPDGPGRGDLLLTQAVLAGPLIRTGLTPLRAHNIIFVVSIAFAGWAVMLLARRLGADLWGGLAAAGCCVCLPYFQSHLWHLQLASFGIGVMALERALAFLDHRGSGWWVPLLLFLQAAAGLYHWVFSLLAMGMVIAWAAIRGHRLRAAALAGLTLLGCVALLPLLRYHIDNAASWPVDQVASADLLSYIAPWESSLLLGGARPDTVVGEVALWPGSAVVLAAAAAVFAPSLRRRLRAPWLLAGLLVVFGLLSLGPTLVVGGRQLAPAPFRLAALLPGMGSVRLPARAGIFALLPLLALAGRALTRRPILAAAAVLACLAEVAHSPIGMLDPPREIEHRWLARNRPGSVLFLPMEPDLDRPETACGRLYGSRLHFVPMVNGYSTSLPRNYLRTAGILNGWPSREADSLLDRMGVECIVYENSALSRADTVLSDGRISISVVLRRTSAGE